MSKYINLIDKLSNKDRELINKYIKLYGIPDNFIGIDEWLQNWSHSNQTLYKILGNKLKVTIDYDYTLSRSSLTKKINNELLRHSFLMCYFDDFYWQYLIRKDDLKLSNEQKEYFSSFFYPSIWVDNKINTSLKFKKNDSNKMLQIQAGSKPLRALTKIIEYFKDDVEFDLKVFEKFKTLYSMIITSKRIKSKMVISIHPFDFLTMSDNNSGWTSCMSWKEEGCYRVGTIEMMNSNNVVCCYLESKEDFIFAEDPETKKQYIWNNKNWRNLFYITKDIIMSGKSYPYENKDFNLFLLEQIKMLAKENKGWTYNFGPELYKDMIHIYTANHMEKNREWIRIGSKYKHNIIWDTKGMYNDMLNDSTTDYWCYRNKVPSTKIISVSGKANCLCCNNDIIYKGKYLKDYNERYCNVGSVICEDCHNRWFSCYHCGVSRCGSSAYKKGKFYEVKDEDENVMVCEYCYKKFYKKCPDCGETFKITCKRVYDHKTSEEGCFIASNNFSKEDLEKINENENVPKINLVSSFKDEASNSSCFDDIFLEVFACPKCKEKLIKEKTTLIKIKNIIHSYPFSSDPFEVKIHILDYKTGEKYLYQNLENAKL